MTLIKTKKKKKSYSPTDKKEICGSMIDFIPILAEYFFSKRS